jgi:RNA polymerase-binding transcription factor DksA
MAQPAKKESLEAFARRTLLERQGELLARHEAAERDAQGLYVQREPDSVDRAADVSAASNLERIEHNELMQLARVTAALARLADGTVGALPRLRSADRRAAAARRARSGAVREVHQSFLRRASCGFERS